MEQISVNSLKTAKVSTAGPGATLFEVAEVMAANRYSCVLIEAEGCPLGILTERDVVGLLLKTQVDARLLERPVSEFMTSPIISVVEDASLFDALVLSRAEKIRHLPVVDKQGQLTGLVTQSDLSNAHFRLIEQQSDLLEQAIRSRTVDLERVNEELRAMSMEDALMEIGNRRAMEVDLEHKHAEALRYGRAYAVVLLDIDFFKKYNDSYGHSAGDVALKLAAKHFRSRVRKSDRIYRYGGEEMLLVLPETEIESALMLAQRLVADFAAICEPHAASDLGILTTSGGVSASNVGEANFGSWQETVEHADLGLYEAKRLGRNRACCADPGGKVSPALLAGAPGESANQPQV